MDSLTTSNVFLCFIKAGWVGLGVARETSVALPCFQVSRCHLWMRHEVISMQNMFFFSKALIFSFFTSCSLKWATRYAIRIPKKFWKAELENIHYSPYQVPFYHWKFNFFVSGFTSQLQRALAFLISTSEFVWNYSRP